MSQSRPPQLSWGPSQQPPAPPFILHLSQDAHSKGESAQADSTLSLMILPWLPMAIWIKTKLLTLAFHLGGLPPHCAPILSNPICGCLRHLFILACPPSEEPAAVLVWQESSRLHTHSSCQCTTTPWCHSTVMKPAALLPHLVSTSQPCSPEQPLLMFLSYSSSDYLHNSKYYV